VPCGHDHVRLEEPRYQVPRLLLPNAVAELPSDRLERALGEREALGVVPLGSRAEQVPKHVERDLPFLIAERTLLVRGRAEVGDPAAPDAGEHVVERRRHGLPDARVPR
jgi:hypothetical protein